MKIGHHDISQRIFVIAEAGINHEGSLDMAFKMVEAAADAQADAIKFQTYNVGDLFAPTEKARIEQRRKFALSQDDFVQLADFCRQKNIIFLSTPFDESSIDFLDNLVPAFKISSIDFTNLKLVQHALKTEKPLLMSCGMSNESKVGTVLDFIAANLGGKSLSQAVMLLHCVSSYPTPYDQVNLKSIPFLSDRFGILPGYSDHTLGINISLAAAALGARVIEKHFTLDKNMTGVRDHKLSADPRELQALVEGVRQISRALGEGGKMVAPSEQESLQMMRRGLYAACDLNPGDVLTEQKIALLLPLAGVPAENYFDLVNRPLKRPLKKGAPIRFEDIG